MLDTYSRICIHVVFSVKFRKPLIDDHWCDERYKYITGIIKNKQQKLLAINGTQDHIHMLIGLRPAISLSELIREIKKSTSTFINETWFSNCEAQIENLRRINPPEADR